VNIVDFIIIYMLASKIYFASDFHLGVPDYESSLIREKKIVRWLDEIQDDAKAIYLMGDLFDFWFEYRNVVPRGFVRLMGKLASMSDRGTEIHVFTGNHDLWISDYLPKEINCILHREPIIKEFDGKTFYLAHGDGLGPGDHGFKMMKKVFTSRISQWAYRRLHPDTGVGVAKFFSRTSHSHTGDKDSNFLGEDKEWLIIHSREVLKKQPIDYFVYGHRHYPLLLPLNEKSWYVNLGDWINYFTYGEWDGLTFQLKTYEG
jgi:UDP-2,3-diacylglucosamine hydrolase